MTELNFVQYLTFKAEPAWRRLADDERLSGRTAFAHELECADNMQTHVYSTLGLKADADLLLWRMSDTPERLQESLSRLLATGLGQYLELTH